MNTLSSTVVSLGCVGIFWDWQNVRCKTLNQFTCLMAFAQFHGAIRHRYVYAHWRKEKEEFETAFSLAEFKSYNIPTLYKDQADAEINRDFRALMKQDHLLKTIILLSCDGGFKDILQKLKEQGKQIIVVSSSRKQSVSEKLENLADHVVYLDELEKAFGFSYAA